MARRTAGFGLIELMIAMVLGLIVMGAAFAVFMSNQNTFNANEGLNRIQESARVAFELMSRDIRAAGGSACSNMSTVEVTNDESRAFRDEPLRGTAGSLTVVSGEDTAYRVIGSTSSSVTLDPLQIADAGEAFEGGNLLLLCNARKTFVVEANTVTTTTVNHTALSDGYDPTDDEFAPPAAVMLARFRNVRWFVQPNLRPGGGSSLFVSRNGAAAEEVAEGVQNVAFEYRRAGATNYTSAPASWNDVVAVRITLTLTGQNVDGQALTRTASNVVSMRSRTL
ncbi:MAG TPA: prepilin-type N-terminal cleavage/methylation domain-containing protein [Luteimonas sp.]|nr:prepilin-type N-terminal cleavage/methylation domain-containing protein [Luteimonas sp.]HRO26575.1 prepilin-type N-terminal cleavage/methylation domain-containing protein [Luteimonas sp.]HRP72572.1 prepilin-type N-terminal cleavage/methylation domain-containing protein [Luteimonas sp.]